MSLMHHLNKKHTVDSILVFFSWQLIIPTGEGLFRCVCLRYLWFSTSACNLSPSLSVLGVQHSPPPSQYIEQSSSVYHWPSIHFSGTDTRGFSNLVRIHRTHGFQTHTYFSNKDLFLCMDEGVNSTTWPNMIRPFTVELAVIIDNT